MANKSTEKIVIKKRLRGVPRHELEKLSKTELIDKIIQLEAYNFQLKNVLNKKLNTEDKLHADYIALAQMAGTDSQESTTTQIDNIATEPKTKQQKQRTFNWLKAHKRHVLLKLLYFGWDYQGFATQEDSNETIEHHLFNALIRTCLIESRSTSNYHRCGRTDKEVSAFCQVISIDLRSKFNATEQLSNDGLSEEIDYCGLLNRILPKNIQCVSWMPLCNPTYSARFDCTARTYRYYFPHGNLDINAMQKACNLLVGHQDYRNFCKMDVHNGVTQYVRDLQSAKIEMCPDEIENDTGYTMYYLEIRANAFLWHQIRYIMAVLLLIGQQKEQPQLVTDLLDVKSNPCKPQYTPAIGLPLNLFECDFREHAEPPTNKTPNTLEANEIGCDTAAGKTMDCNCAWIYNEDTLQRLIENLQSEWTQACIKTTMIRNVLHKLEQIISSEFKQHQIKAQVYLLQDFIKPRQYQQLLERKRCESLENRIEHYVKKQRLTVQIKE